MKLSKIIPTSTFALSLSLVSLAAGATTGCGGASSMTQKGSQSKCGASNCGEKKTEKGAVASCGEEKIEKGAVASCGEEKTEKGADSKCGAGSCG